MRNPKTKWIGYLALMSTAALAGFLLGRRGSPPAAETTLEPPIWMTYRVETSQTPEAHMFRRDGGLWTRRRARGEASSGEGSLDRLLTLPYVTGSQPAEERTGVTRFDRAKASLGLNLYSSAHGPEARLIDMEGNLLHQWYLDRDQVWPDLADSDTEEMSRKYFRRIQLLDQGSLLAIYEYVGLVKIDARSRLVWSHRRSNHHDFDIDRDGNIFVLTRESRSLPYLAEPGTVWDEEIAVLSPQGEQLQVVSISACFHRSSYAPLLDLGRRFRGPQPVDVFHANTIQLIDESLAIEGSAFQPGRLLVSLRNINTIAVIDLDSQKVVWALTGAWRMQHDPVLLSTGRMLLFDNLGLEDRSRVVEFDPLTQVISWEYRGSAEAPFFSLLQGTNQRLENGNTLVTESDYGRAFELTPDGEIVWEFVSPHRTGESDEFVAVIPEMIRLPADLPLAQWE